ncbi:hypothetical protein JSO61_009190 [Riemerella anatipestifer]|uniref:hypothetical protein n=1 Tax=Riemerella anatipestifer TaxID=34085 RepID=UPI0030BA9CC4
MNIKQKLLISSIGFVIIFSLFNINSKFLDFFKSNDELFYEYYKPIEMNKEKFIGEIADSSNHMYPYLRFEKTCLPKIEQWNNKFEVGDEVSKTKGSLNLLIEKNGVKKILEFETKNFPGSALPCDCKEILK